jgi:dihydrofolate reductase
MRKLVLKMDVSLDGFVGATDGDVEWIFRGHDDEAREWIVKQLWQAGVHAMGRVTYGDMAAYWPSSTEVFAAPMNEIPKVVFSKTLTDPAWDDTTVLDGDLAEEIASLKRETGKDILAHGGAGFAQSLSRLGLVDEYRLIQHPVALGSGLPLFAEPVDLRKVSTTPFATGAVALTFTRA